MKILDYRKSDFAAGLEVIYNRPSYPATIEDAVRNIVNNVRSEGDKALQRYALEFDKAELTPAEFKVSAAEIAAAEKSLDKSAKAAIKTALKNVQSFARLRIPKAWKKLVRKGVTLGEQFVPMERVGVYIPGGTAPLVSTVIHTAGIAKAAGVKEIVAVTPPGKDGKVHPAVLYAMKAAGVTEIYRLGGVYGIAAMAYGTETVPKVEKIVGPGNAYVTAAKKLVYGAVAIDMVAGPSEIMVIADETADPDKIAADMLSQAEHGSGLEQALTVTTDETMPEKILTALSERKSTLPRMATVDKVLEQGSWIIVVKDMAQASEIAGKYAPEHLEICCKDARKVAKTIKAAGALFIGHWAPEPIGDFCAGPSHVLPTAGSAKFFSGLTVEGFFRRMSTVEYTEEAIQKEIAVAEKFAEMEGLAAHGRSASSRRSK
ncbi:MAG: histidinol dehydrogenase [Lentisphaeria bacterium]|nr:histidinol dehydrogenase [Lentisphaeria bacterium]MBR7145070.1 histidinol dehydrogenase [Lentisphaeria bacterium]